MPPPSHFTTTILPPPGPSISKPRSTPTVDPNAPPTFIDAMTVRTVVFVHEQHCRLEEELDDDDARSWHWVMYAQPPPPSPPPPPPLPPSSKVNVDVSKQTPIGVIRLVPPPHAPHCHDSSETKDWESSEPYIKITRVAVLHAYRGLGLSRVLVDTVLDWAANHADELSSAISGEGKRKRWDGLVLVHAQVSVEGCMGRWGLLRIRVWGCGLRRVLIMLRCGRR